MFEAIEPTQEKNMHVWQRAWGHGGGGGGGCPVMTVTGNPRSTAL